MSTTTLRSSDAHARKRRAAAPVSSSPRAATTHFGASPFKFAVPAGFTPLAQAASAHVVFTSFSDDSPAGAGATPLAIVLEPSRDLAEQTYQCLNDYKKHTPAPKIASMLAVGGVDMGAQACAFCSR